MLLSGSIHEDRGDRVIPVCFLDSHLSVIDDDIASVGHETGVVLLRAVGGHDGEGIVGLLAGYVDFIGRCRNLVDREEFEHTVLEFSLLIEDEGYLVTSLGRHLDDILLMQVDGPGLVVVNALAVAEVYGFGTDCRRPGCILNYGISLGVTGCADTETAGTGRELGVGCDVNLNGPFLGRRPGGEHGDPG